MDAEVQAKLEGELCGRLDRGDTRDAAKLAIEGYGPQVLAHFVALLREEEAAAGEAFSEFGEELWRSIGVFRRDSSFRTWAYAIAWNVVRRTRRRETRRRRRWPDGRSYANADLRLLSELQLVTGLR